MATNADPGTETTGKTDRSVILASYIPLTMSFVRVLCLIHFLVATQSQSTPSMMMMMAVISLHAVECVRMPFVPILLLTKSIEAYLFQRPASATC